MLSLRGWRAASPVVRHARVVCPKRFVAEARYHTLCSHFEGMGTSGVTDRAQPIEVETFFAVLRDRTADGLYMVSLEGGVLPVWVELRDSPQLVITFAGAAPREDPPYPYFATGSLRNYVTASFVRIADPSLAPGAGLRLAWYAGRENFELQKLLPGIIQGIIDCLGVHRVVFIGASGGAFASLYYSRKIPNSVALALNPQTNLDRYRGGDLHDQYRRFCWPALAKTAPLDSIIDANLVRLYAEQSLNTVIVLQTASDFTHLTRHLAPFLAAYPFGQRERLIVRVADWGVEGHTPAPSSIWVPWAIAALTAVEATAPSIEAVWAEQNPGETGSLLESPFAPERQRQIATSLARRATAELLGSYATSTEV